MRAELIDGSAVAERIRCEVDAQVSKTVEAVRLQQRAADARLEVAHDR
jgi:hypothetical protein